MDGHKIVGIGETGFCFKKVEHAVIPDDLKRMPHGEEQEKAFIAHMQLAKACALPLITHIRGGSEELTEQLEIYSLQLCAKYLPSDHVIIRHCFVRSARIAAMWRSHFPNVVFSHAPTLCDDRRNAAEKQTVTDFWLQHQMAESDAPYFFYDNKYLGNSGLVLRVYRKIMRLRRAGTPEDRRAVQYYLTSNVLRAYRIDIRLWEASWRKLIIGRDPLVGTWDQLGSDDALAAMGFIETDVMDSESGPSTSAAAARGPSRSEDHDDEHEGNIAQVESDQSDLEEIEASTDISASADDLPVDQATGFPSFPPETPLDVRREFSSFTVDNTSDTSLEPFHECTGQGRHINCVPIRVRDIMPKSFTETEVEDLVAKCPLQVILVRWVGRLFPRPGPAIFEFLRELLRSGGVYQSIWVFEKHSNILGALPDRGPVLTVTKDDASAGYFRWSKNCRIAQRFLFDHPRGPLTTGFQFHRQLCGRSHQTWDRLNFTHVIDEVRCKVNPRHAQMTYLPTVRTNTGDCEVLCICDRRGQALYASDPRQALNFVMRRYLPYCVTTLIVCCGADRLYDDTTYRSYEADVRDLAAYLSKFYPYLRVRIIHPMFVPERLEEWRNVILPAKDNFRNVMASADESAVRDQTHLLFIDLSVDRDLHKFHRRTGHKSPELVSPTGYATFFGLEMRLNETWRCFGFDLGDTVDPGPVPVPHAVNVPPSQHPRDISDNSSQIRVQAPHVSVPGSLQVIVQPGQPSRQVQNVPGPNQMHAARPAPL
ncbi:deoxyribonuclease TATDN2, partial [Aphelenchoides avenae]